MNVMKTNAYQLIQDYLQIEKLFQLTMIKDGLNIQLNLSLIDNSKKIFESSFVNYVTQRFAKLTSLLYKSIKRII